MGVGVGLLLMGVLNLWRDSGLAVGLFSAGVVAVLLSAVGHLRLKRHVEEES